MELIRAGFRSKHSLQPCGAAVFTTECVDLNAGFLDSFRLRGQIQDPLPNAAGYIQAIYNVLVIILTLTVRAGVNLLFCGEVVHARGWTPGCACS